MGFKCRFCNNNSWIEIVKFKGSTDNYKAEYFRYGICKACRSIVLFENIIPDYEVYASSRKGYRTAKAKRFIKFLQKENISKKLKLLDYGCGEGKLVNELKEEGYNIAGYDPYSKSCSKFPIPGSKYDVITIIQVFEHLLDFDLFFSNIQKIAKKGTKIIVACPISDEISHLDPNDPLQKQALHTPYHIVIPSSEYIIKKFNAEGYRFKRKIKGDIIRDGILVNNNVTAFLQDKLGGTRERLFYSSMTEKIKIILKSLPLFLKTMFITTKSPYIATFIFEKE